MTGNKLFDCQRMFRHACAFSDCADFAMSEFDPKKIDVEWYTTPATVNSAFACEVYLKALLVYYDNPLPKQHELEKLFELLPDKTKEWIMLTVIKFHGAWKDAFGYNLLDNISNAFLNWRYIYEGKETRNGKRIERSSFHIDISFLTVFRNTLREACCQLFFGKTWEEYLAN